MTRINGEKYLTLYVNDYNSVQYGTVWLSSMKRDQTPLPECLLSFVSVSQAQLLRQCDPK